MGEKAGFQLSNLLFLMVILHQPSSYGRPTSTTANTCDDKEVAIMNKQGKIDCWELIKKCPHGNGLSFQFISGKIYPPGTMIACPSCKPGLTYSDKDDFSQCQNCTQCKEHELSTGQCNIDKDSVICLGKCEDGFYWNNSTCLPCSECCGDVIDEKPPDCSISSGKNSIPTRKSCSVESSILHISCISAKNITAKNTTIIIESNGDVQDLYPTEMKIKEAGKSPPVLFTVFCILLMVVVLIVVAVVICCCPSRESIINNGHFQIVNNQRLVNRSLQFESSASSSLSTSSSCGQPLLELACTDNPVASSSKSSNNTSTADRFKGLFSCFYPVQVKLSSKVKKLPEKKYKELCIMLDDEHSFFKDYRLFGEELKMEKSEIDKARPNPTKFILEKHSSIDIQRLIELLIKIEREDIAEVVMSWLS